ncbi:MAG: response regulator [Candidatus Thorarchaeota archaeon]
MGVIIASDVPLLRSLILMAIQDAGFSVIGEVGTIPKLLEFCRENEVAIAILDLHLGEGEFLQTIEKVLDVDSEIAILAVTDWVDIEVQRALSAGARAVLQKPFSIYDLIDMIRKIYPVI